MKNKEIFLETATKIGNRLVKNAIWEGDKCTWNVMSPDRENPKNRKAIEIKAGATVYQGTAGIVIFLVELNKIKSNEKLLKTIKGAINFSIDEAKNLGNNSFGFHSGRIGIAYAIVKAVEILKENNYLEQAKNILRPLEGNEKADYGIDVIGGAAGAIPALLIMEQNFNDNFCLDMAIALGENLIAKANMETTGWSWEANSKYNFRNLLGYAHGTAGIAHAFLELYNATNSSYFLYAAEQAFLYERQFNNQELFNWPDFRHSELSDYIYNNELEKLKEALKNNSFSPYNKKFMTAWCHGAPGIGLSRIRAFQILNEDIFLEETEIAITGTNISLEEKIGANYSLCHGIGGNCDLLIESANVLDKTIYYKTAEKYGIQGWEDFESKKKQWPCGTMESVNDPSLMLGEAGIGYFYLRLFSKNIPSILLLSSKIKNEKKSNKNYNALQNNYINNYFGKTIDIINRVSSSKIEQSEIIFGETISDITKTYHAINDFIDNTNKQNATILKDAFKLEKRKYELSIGLTEYYQEFTNELVKENVENIIWKDSLIKLSPLVEILETSWDWDMFLQKGNNKNNLSDYKKEKYLLIHRVQNKIVSKNLSPFIFSLLSIIKENSKLDNIVQNIAELLGDENTDSFDTLEKTIVSQLIEMYKANIISIENDILYDDFIIKTTKDILLSHKDQRSNSEIAITGIYQILRTSKKHLSNEDELYRLYQIDSYMSILFLNLEELNLLHYYQKIVNSYQKKRVNKEKVFLEFLDLLSTTFINNKDYYIINQ